MSFYKINSRSLWLYYVNALKYGHIQFAKINAYNSSNPLSPTATHYSLTMWKLAVSIASNVISFQERYQLTFPKLANSHLKLQLTSMRLQPRSRQSTERWNRLCGHSSGVGGMCQISQSNGSMTAEISEVADVPRHPSTRMLSKAGFWGGTAPAGNSLSSAEIGFCSELHVLFFSSCHE